VKRWLLWNLRCARGRLCAHLVVDEVEIPPGYKAKLRLEWTCGGCGTHYRGDGVRKWRTREVSHPVATASVGSLAGGESKIAEFALPDPLFEPSDPFADAADHNGKGDHGAEDDREPGR
jgi:hypothetical protein